MNPITDLDLAVEDLKSISQGSHSDSKKFKAVLSAIENLQRVSHTVLNQQLDVMTRGQLEGAYADLHKACREYMEGKGTSRFSSYGQGRLHCVQEIDRIISLDMKGLSRLPKTGPANKTLLEVIAEARAADVNVDDPAAVTTVGGQMSQRIPLQVSELAEDRAGFFTGASQVDFGQEFAKIARKRHTMTLDPIFKTIGSDPNEICIEIVDAFEDAVKQARRDDENADGSTVFDDMLKDGGIRKYPAFKNILTDHGLAESDLNRLFGNSAATKEYVHLIGDILDHAGPYYMNSKVARIPDGEDLSKRNVGMTRVGDALGMRGLIARAETMSLNVGGQLKQGVFMEKATGEDINHLTPDSSMAKNVDKLSVNSGSFAAQLADLQVLDYLCGNIDRHLGNMLYHTEQIGGKTVVTGITGIDNDMSFGRIMGSDTGDRSRLVRPGDMMFMRQSTADAVKGLKPEALELMLQDLNFTPQEIAAAKSRLEALQTQIDNDKDYFKDREATASEAGHIHILSDEQFEKLNIEEISAAMDEAVEKGTRKANYFYNAGFIPEEVRDIVDEMQAKDHRQEKGITYAAATGSWKYEQDNRPIAFSSMEDAHQELLDIAKMLDDADHRAHIDSGSYKWMKQSLAELTAKTAKLAEMAKNGQTGNLPEEEVKELDRLYRELNKAGAGYQKTHQGKRRSGMGRVRQDMAKAMTELRAPHGPQAKTKMSVKDMPETQASDAKTRNSERVAEFKASRKQAVQEKNSQRKTSKTAVSSDG